MNDFDRSYERVLAYEGGRSNDPDDPGGATNLGVSLRAVVELRDANGALEFDLDKDGDVDDADIGMLRPDLVKRFYFERYWLLSGASRFVWPINFALFDAAVNCGPRQSVVLFQKAVCVNPDGVIGPATLLAAVRRDPETLLVDMLTQRARFYADLSARRGSKFLNGWLRRLFMLQRDARRTL